MIQGLPFTLSSQTALAPQAYGCAGQGGSGDSGFCVWGAGSLPQPSGFPLPPAVGKPSGGGPPYAMCQVPQIPQN